ATDWVEDGWNPDETVELARRLKDLGVDLIDVSSGGTAANAEIPVGPGYQTEFAERVKKEAGIASGTVGMITEPVQAEHILRTGQAIVHSSGNNTGTHYNLQVAAETAMMTKERFV
ncbi:DUF6351 family protein, partial [Escherichia coli]|uniref:DUF6351 family protein n=1 Tax=Escherichia coli TaxID=562 RepID=UPI00203E6B09